MTQDLVGHSPVGFSGAHRYMRCPGSVALIKQLVGAPEDDPDYRRDGVLAHAIGAEALKRNVDPWMIAHEYAEVLAEVEDAGGILKSLQVYVDYVRAIPGGTRDTERTWHRPELHELAWGTIDHSIVATTCLHIIDYKNGIGVNVEVERNPQLMGYGYLMLGDGGPGQFDDDEPVKLHVVQPRGFHHEGPCRSWETTAGEIRQWAREVLKGAIEMALNPQNGAWLELGEWCQFCPAKLVCPAQHQITRMFAGEPDPELQRISDERLGELFAMMPAIKARLKMVQEEADRRNMAPNTAPVPGTKLVHKIAHRVWKPGALDAMQAIAGERVYKDREMRTPADMEALGPAEKALVAEWAYKPEGGYTTVLESDARSAVTIESIAARLGVVPEATLAVEIVEPPRRRGRPRRQAA